MTIALSYLSDLSRVRVALSDLPDGTVQVQRAANASATDAMWQRGIVRGGSALPIESGSGQIDDYEFFADVATHYRVIDDEGVVLETGSITPDLGGEVWIKSIKYPATNRAVRLVDRGEDVGRGSRSTVHAIVGRSVGVATHDRRVGRRWTLHVMTAGPDHAEQAGELDIILAAGGDFFIHVPAALVGAVPGGYVAIDSELVESRLYRGDPDAPRVFSIPCTSVAPPRPTVTGTLLTGATVLRLYGSGGALISAHPTGRSLLATMLDPDDLVVVD